MTVFHKTHVGVVGPTIPQLEQCIQVGIGVRDTTIDAKPHLYPFTAMLKPKDRPLMLANGKAAPGDIHLCSGSAPHGGDGSAITIVTHEFWGISLSGVTNPDVAKNYPDSVGRLSVQRHGIATAFKVMNKTAIAQARYGAVVFISGTPSEQGRNAGGGKIEVVHIRGFREEESFWPYEIKVDGTFTHTYNPVTDIKIGHLVQLPPQDANDIRIWLSAPLPLPSPSDFGGRMPYEAAVTFIDLLGGDFPTASDCAKILVALDVLDLSSSSSEAEAAVNGAIKSKTVSIIVSAVTAIIKPDSSWANEFKRCIASFATVCSMDDKIELNAYLFAYMVGPNAFAKDNAIASKPAPVKADEYYEELAQILFDSDTTARDSWMLSTTRSVLAKATSGEACATALEAAVRTAVKKRKRSS